MPSGTLRTLAVAALAATRTETKDHSYAEATALRRPTCSVCGASSDFVRHGTLARRRLPWRWW